MNRQIKSRVGVSGFLFALLVTLAGGAVAAGITNSKHDLSVNSTGATIKATAQTEICVFCHTPHGASTTANTPLWNHTASASGSFGVYTNTNSMNAADIAAVTGGDGTTSSLCMSCHDGSVAVNSQNNVSNNGLSNSINAVANRVDATGKLTSDNSANLGTGVTALTNDHPINFTYDAALVTADGGLVAPGSITGAKLFGGKVQCASCHDVHDSTNGVFLRASMAGSSLCLKCHIK